MSAAPALEQRIYFEDVEIGMQMPGREHGPLTIADTVRWAGLQENWLPLHFDRDFARAHNGLRTFIASGSYREALLIRMITDWISPRGMLRKITLRQVASTYEGDMIRLSGRVLDRAPDTADPWVVCELAGQSQHGEEILRGRCTVVLPCRCDGPPTGDRKANPENAGGRAE